jgi:hypothetical protein
MRYQAKKNSSGGPGWNVIDITTCRNVAWIYDQMYGHKHTEEDERRAKLFADALNGVGLS